MTIQTTDEIRQAFLAFFEQKGHQVVPSSSLVPQGDQTLLFTNAGMVQFKECFLGQEKRSYVRATSSQRCVRAGGKHNDLENVGYTARHHTFFEMLGNFSFGDYFKEEAITLAWTFLTQVLKLPEEKLWVTVYKDDQEAEEIWFNKIGIDQTRFSRLGEKDNFWAMGDTGPCGPCTEIFYDHGDTVFGGPPGSPDEDGDRYIEIWNLVFMQFNRTNDGVMHPLPKPSVDTGMGLERIAAVMQGKHNNYDIDIFAALIQAIAELLQQSDATQQSLRVIADHIRSTVFLIVDGVVPSNEGRGYVLRRIMRRAIRHGHRLNASSTFLHKLVTPLIQQMGAAYPELKVQQTLIEQTILKEEEQFARTLDKGMSILNKAFEQLEGDMISGETAFLLYDTYGFPIDLTADIAREKQLQIDREGFERCMNEQRQRSQASGQFNVDYNQQLHFDGETHFVGYDVLEKTSVIDHLLVNGEKQEQAETGSDVLLVTQETPCYAESGGQVGDVGTVVGHQGQGHILDTQKVNETYVHQVKVTQGSLSVGETVTLQVTKEQRQATAIHHSATHLMHAALRQILGEHVVQKGSLVDSDKLRFDFSHTQPVSPEEQQAIEDLVNQEIRQNHLVLTEEMSMSAAKTKGAMALFGEKYGETVRVLSMGAFSVELCGGTHVKRTGDIGCFKLISETGIAAGVRRIEAVAGQVALDHVRKQEQELFTLSQLLKVEPSLISEKISGLLQKNKTLEKSIHQLQNKAASEQGNDLANNTIEIKGIKVVVTQLPQCEPKSLRDLMDQVKNKLGSGVVLLGGIAQSKAHLIAGVTKDLTQQIQANALIKVAAELVDGKGGGRPDMAQAGGTNPDKLSDALEAAKHYIKEQLS